MKKNISNKISKITTWLHSNKLKLNASKSKCMTFFKHPKIIPKLNILANGNPIDEVQEFNFLGITIDQNLTWTPHIRKISIKISRVIGVLRKLKQIFPQHILRLIYNSLIHPKFDLIMYADDTTLVSTLETFGNNNIPTEIENNINNKISKITTWLHSNKLKLNASKSKCMIFFTHPKIIPKLNILANGNPIDEVQEFNFLGITIDQNLTWTPHIRKIFIKISRVIGVLRKLKRIFPQHTLRLIYNSFIHPHHIYGLNLWGFKHKRITISQKKAIRILAFRPYISHSTTAFKELKIPMLKDLYIIQLYEIYYKNIHNILPVYFQKFSPNYNNGTAHNRNLRYQALRLPMTRKEYYAQSTKYQLLIRETPQLELDRCLTSSLMQFVAYFKYKIIGAYNAVCNIRNCYVCQ